jgi:hypothetical protein
MARRTASKPAEKPAEDWNAPDAAGENSAADTEQHENQDEGDQDENLDDQDEGEGGDAPDEDAAADFAAMSRTDHDAPDPHAEEVYRQHDNDTGGTEGLALGQVLSPRQRAGIDPVNVDQHVSDASRRLEMTNAQTRHEAENTLDGVSGTSSPGVTRDVRHTAPGPANDMSGRLAMPDPFAGLETSAREAMNRLSAASKEAHARGRGAGHGWVDLRTLAAPKAVMDALVKAGMVDQDVRPGGAFSPETGTVYRIVGHE